MIVGGSMRAKGWKPDTPDIRDHQYAPRRLGRQARTIDLRNRFFKPWQQGSLGSCTAHAVGAACQYLDVFDNDMEVVTPSRLFLYWNARAIEGTITTDSGVEIRSAIKAAVKFGYPPESAWRYVISRFKKKPPTSVFNVARREVVREYSRVNRSISHFRRLLADGLPIVIGISCYESLDSERVSATGRIPMPKRSERMTGGHAVLVVGYDWGKDGYGFLPYGYIESPDLSDDFWVIKS
jgi:C1A family cysteine protease